MNAFLNYLVPGIIDGSVYALCAMGLVLTYKTSGVFNFAHGALAATSAYAFYEFHIKQGMAWPLAFVLALLLVGVGGGLILERFATALADAPTVSIVVATVGLLVLLQSLCTAIYGSATIQLRRYLPSASVQIGSINVTVGDFIVTAGTLATAAGLYFFFKSARLGKAMTAVVDDPNLLSLQATDPARVRRLAWIVGSCLASISGMLLAPKLGVSVNQLILLVIAAYGAAAIGLFDNLPLTVLGGIGIGIGVNYLPSLTADSHYYVVRNIFSNLPFLVLFAVLIVVPRRKLTLRGVRNARRLRPVRTFSPQLTMGALGAGLLVLILVPQFVEKFSLPQYASALGYVIIFASLGLITWTSGQISLCHLGFAAIGAAACGHALSNGVPWPLAVLFAGLITVPAGAIVAIPAIRLSGIYVAVATFGFGILLQEIFYQSAAMFGVANAVKVPRPHILGIDFTSDTGYYYLALFVTVLSCALVVIVRRSRLGSLLRALSDSPDALEAHGTNTTLTRVLVFCIASFLAGVGGAVLSGVAQTASGSAGGTFDFTVSLVFVAVLGFCGRRPLVGPFLAAFLLQVLKIYPPFDDATFLKYQGVLFGAAAIFVAIGPTINLRAIGGQRADERGPTSPVWERVDEVAAAEAIQPRRRVLVDVTAGAARPLAEEPIQPRARAGTGAR